MADSQKVETAGQADRAINCTSPHTGPKWPMGKEKAMLSTLKMKLYVVMTIQA